MELADFRENGQFHASGVYRVALLIPLCGAAGIWAPSCISSAQVAVAELNKADGIDGRKVQLIMIDAAVEAAEPIEEIVNDLIDLGAIDAIVGMHLSAIRQRLSKVVRQRIPYIYTPLYEGGETTAGLFAIGETPKEQLGPAMMFMQKRFKPRKWALIGNDYVWPRASHAIAKECIAQNGGSVVFEGYVPFGLEEPAWLVERIAQSEPDIVLVSLVGQDAVEFNRVFGAMDLDRHMIRFSPAMEENVLLATGAGNSRRLFVGSSYFAAHEPDRAIAFREAYHAMHSETAPYLNSLGQSLYEGIQFYSSLVEHRRCGGNNPISYDSARGGRFYSNDRIYAPTFLARADGHRFSILESLA